MHSSLVIFTVLDDLSQVTATCCHKSSALATAFCDECNSEHEAWDDMKMITLAKIIMTFMTHIIILVIIKMCLKLLKWYQNKLVKQTFINILLRVHK